MDTPYDLQKNLINILKLEAWPEEKRVALLNGASELIQKRLMLRMTEKLSQEELDEVSALMETPERMMELLAQKSGLDILAAIQEETDKLAEELRPATEEA